MKRTIASVVRLLPLLAIPLLSLTLSTDRATALRLAFPGTILAATFSQLDFDLDRGRITITDSEWGSLGLTFVGSRTILYVNLSIGPVIIGPDRLTDKWVIQNIPLPSVEDLATELSVSLNFDLGVPTGQHVESLRVGLTVSGEPLTSPPPATEIVSVQDDIHIFASGIQGQAAQLQDAKPLKGGKARDRKGRVKEDFPNQSARLNECGPVALSNSLKWLNDKHNLGIPAADLTIEHLGRVTGLTTAGIRENWWSLKRDAFSEKVETTSTQQIGDVVKALKRCDVEVHSGAHIVAVTGIIPLEDGTYTFYVANDTQQDIDDVSDGRATEIVKYSPTKRDISGSTFWGGKVKRFVIECPKERY